MSEARVFTLDPITGGGTVPEWNVADRLRKAREHAGLEQAELAQLTAISRATISAAENGRTRLREASVRLWAVSTGVSLAWLKTGEAPQDTPGGPVLPEMDSNHQPAGNKPLALVTSLDARRAA